MAHLPPVLTLVMSLIVDSSCNHFRSPFGGGAHLPRAAAVSVGRPRRRAAACQSAPSARARCIRPCVCRLPRRGEGVGVRAAGPGRAFAPVVRGVRPRLRPRPAPRLLPPGGGLSSPARSLRCGPAPSAARCCGGLCSCLRPRAPVGVAGLRRARAPPRLITAAAGASAADHLVRQRPFLLALPPLPPKDTTATEPRGSSAVYFFFSARVAIDGSFPTAPSSARTCNDYALAAVRQSGSGILRRFPLASTPSQRSTRGLPVMASTLVPCTFTFVFTR